MWGAFRAVIPNSEAWELRWYSGGSIDIWANPEHTAWTYSGDPDNTGGLIDPVGASDDEEAVDRVVLNVSGLSSALSDSYGTLGVGGYSGNVTQWVEYTAAAIDNVRAVHPNARLIYLQPQIGGVFGAETSCTTVDANAVGFGVVRCAWSARFTRSALATLCTGNVRMGFIQYADDCADFEDWAGHITEEAQSVRGAAMANFYAVHL